MSGHYQVSPLSRHCWSRRISTHRIPGAALDKSLFITLVSLYAHYELKWLRYHALGSQGSLGIWKDWELLSSQELRSHGQALATSR